MIVVPYYRPLQKREPHAIFDYALAEEGDRLKAAGGRVYFSRKDERGQ